jgi:uncharacterized membrane protein YeaQ/YmgE (transglycosylase-associated protein family)
MSVDPGIILGILSGVFNAALFVVIRGSAGGRLPLLLGASIVGAWAGDTLGDRLGRDPFPIGDFGLISATIGAWIGIAFMSVLVVLGPTRPRI